MLLIAASKPIRSHRNTRFRTVELDLEWLHRIVHGVRTWTHPSVRYRYKILEIDTGETYVDFDDIILLAFEIGVNLKNCTLEIDENTHTLVLGIHQPPILWRPKGKPFPPPK